MLGLMLGQVVLSQLMLLQLMLLQLGLKLMLMMMLPHAGADAAKAGVGGAEEAGAVAPCWGLRGPLLPMLLLLKFLWLRLVLLVLLHCVLRLLLSLR